MVATGQTEHFLPHLQNHLVHYFRSRFFDFLGLLGRGWREGSRFGLCLCCFRGIILDFYSAFDLPLRFAFGPRVLSLPPGGHGGLGVFKPARCLPTVGTGSSLAPAYCLRPVQDSGSLDVAVPVQVIGEFYEIYSLVLILFYHPLQDEPQGSAIFFLAVLESLGGEGLP